MGKPLAEALAKHIAAESLLDHFLLVGGTALSIYLNHRLSEDLDFATTDKSLPKKAISTLLERLTNEGRAIEDVTPVAARQDANKQPRSKLSRCARLRYAKRGITTASSNV